MTSSIQLLRSTIYQERPLAGNLLEGQPAANLHSSEPGLFFKTTDGSVVKFGPAAITSDGSPPNSAPQGSSGNSVGELWLDKSVDPAVLKVYDGAQWVDAGSGGGGGTTSFLRWIYTAVGGETSLSGSSGGVSLVYTPGLEEVYVNGVLITRGADYSAINGTSITNLSALTAGDIVTVLSMNPASTVQLPGQVTLTRWTVLASAGQIVLSGVDSFGQQLVYAPGFEEVYVNGAFLRRGVDYVATDGATITGLSPLALDDEVTVMAWTPFSIGTQIVDSDVAPDAGVQAGKLAFTQDGSGAIARTVQSKLEEYLSVTDFGAKGNGVDDDTNAFKAAITAAMATGRKNVFVPVGDYVISDELDLNGSVFPERFSGVALIGEDVRFSRIRFKPAATNSICISLRGGSGTHTNKYVKSLTIEPFDASYNEMGRGIYIDGQCFAVVSEIVCTRLDTGIHITNTHPGSFSEFNTFDTIRLLECHKGITFEVNGGRESFHGTRCWGVEINVPANGYGIYSRGISDVCYIYNSYFFVQLFGNNGDAPGTRFGIYAENTNTQTCFGEITCEGDITLKATANGQWQMQGDFANVNTTYYDAPTYGQFLFNRVRNGSTFANASISSYSPSIFDPNLTDQNTNGDFPAIFKMTGSNFGSIGIASYAFAGNGTFFGSIGFNDRLEDFNPGLRISQDGTTIQGYSPSGLQLRDSSGANEQLLLSNGRTGGRIGRSLDYSVAAAAGSPQNISTITNAAADRASIVFVRIAGSGLDYRRLLVMNHNGSGSPGYVAELAALVSLIPAGVSGISFSVNSSGTLVVSITTNINATIQCRELGLGFQLTI